jgi:hypothetical protein
MIKIENSSYNGLEAKVYFTVIQPNGKTTEHYIAAKLPNKKYDEPAMINVPAIGDIQLGKAPEFIKAVELAAMIASGELEAE